MRAVEMTCGVAVCRRETGKERAKEDWIGGVEIRKKGHNDVSDRGV